MKCPRCGKELKDVAAHIKRVHPEASYMRPDDPRPHPQAMEITLEREDIGPSYVDIATLYEWHTERYGSRRHGWFIPVEVADNEPWMRSEMEKSLDELFGEAE